MNCSKVIITKHESIYKKYSFENEIGLSTYDLAMISINEIINKNKSSKKEDIKNSYLI